MDKGTDAYDMLTGKIIPLKLGFIGVVNRSQQDINTRKPIKQSLKEEAEFFSSHPIYRSIASRCGTPFLSKTLNRVTSFVVLKFSSFALLNFVCHQKRS